MNSGFKRILIAEDSAVTQDILNLVLTHRNHEVRLAGTGEEALQYLLDEIFDVVLMDFHLPDIKGIEVANRFLAAREGQEIPTLIAMTGDPEALLASMEDCEVFEKVLTKPIEIEDVVPVIEAKDACRKIHNPTPEPEPEPEPEVHPITTFGDLPFQDLGFDILYLPYDIESAQAKRNTANRLRLRGCPDLVVVVTSLDDDEESYYSTLNPAHLAPIIDLSDTLKNRAEISARRAHISDEAVRKIVRQYRLLREEMHSDFLHPQNDEERLIGMIHVRGGKLIPQYEPESRQYVRYNAPVDADDAEIIAGNLAKQGLLSSEFFDRMFVCGSCQSSRLMVREECPQCRDTRLNEEYYLHHFRCAFQGPETAFRRGDKLICPKCRRELTHYGVNYNKPGLQHICRKCGHSSTDPAVGFLCVDCLTRTDGEKIQNVDRYAFKLTEFGREFISAGRILISGSSRAIRFSDLPVEFSIRLNSAARRYMDTQEPFALINIGYANLAAMTRNHGESETTRNREMLMTLLKETLPSVEAFASSKSGEYILLRNTHESEAQTFIEDNLHRFKNKINIALDAVTVAYGPEQLA